MTNDVVAAAARLRRAADGTFTIPGEIYNDVRTLLSYVLATVAADDDEPATEAWFATLGPARCGHIKLYMDEERGEPRLLVDNGYDSIPLLWQPTRGQVRKVAAALNIVTPIGQEAGK